MRHYIYWMNGFSRIKERIVSEVGEFGVGSILSIAVALIVSAFVLVPGMKGFADNIMQGMADWWDNSISQQIFPNV